MRLRIDADAPDLHRVAWEALYDPGDAGQTDVHIAATNATPFSRYIAGKWQTGTPLTGRPLRILVAAPRQVDFRTTFPDPQMVEIDPDYEFRGLEDALRQLLDRHAVELTLLPQPVTLAHIDEELRRGYHVLHLVCHGSYSQQLEVAALCLANASNRVKFEKENAVATVLAQQFAGTQPDAERGLRLIYLASCQTAERATADAFRGMAPQMVAAGVPAVVAMQDNVAVSTARTFAATFYRQVLDHGQVDLAANEARAQVFAARLPGPVMPVLFSRLVDGRLLAESQPGANGHQQEPAHRLWVNVPALANLDNIVGRAALVDDLVARLLRGHSPALSADGLPGVGKTTLAVVLAHDERVRAHFPDGVLWAGLGPNPDVASIQAMWGDAFGVDLRDVPDVRRRQDRISAALADQRVLVVIDDAWQAEAAQALRCSGPHVGHVLTTRNESIARAFAGARQAVKVPVLDDETAWGLLQRLAPEACAADAKAARELADAVGGLPLAVELLGGYLAAPERVVFADLNAEALATLKDPAHRLALAQQRLGSVTGQIETLAAVIRLSVENLPEDAHIAFFAMGAFAPKPATFARAAAEAVTGAPASVLALLVARNLLEVGAGSALAVHQVVHDFAATGVQAEAVERHRAYYLDLVNGDREDWQTIEANYGQLRHGLEQLPDGSVSVIDFVRALCLYWVRRGLAAEHLCWAQRALAVAKTSGQAETEAILLNNIGWVYSTLGDKAQALQNYEQALSLSWHMGDKASEARTINNIGRVYSALGEKVQALQYYEEALPMRRQAGDKSGEAATLNNIGGVYFALGEKIQALKYYEQAFSLICQEGDKSGAAATLNNIGGIYFAEGRLEQAAEIMREIIEIVREMGLVADEAGYLYNLAAVLHSLDRRAEAADLLRRSIALLHQKNLPQDANGGTLAQHDALLALTTAAA